MQLFKKHSKPTIVCLCGSTKFYNEYVKANFDETLKGNIVLSVGFFMHNFEKIHNGINITSEQKIFFR